MSEVPPETPSDEIDEELLQALGAAFGDDAMQLLDDDDDSDELPAEMLAEISADQPEIADDAAGTDGPDDQPAEGSSLLDRLLNQLVFAVNPDCSVELPNHKTVNGQSQATPTKSRYVVFEVDTTRFAVPLSDVQEIARSLTVTALPRTPAWLRGVTNLRGDILSVTDLRHLLKLPGERPWVGEKIIVVHGKQNASATAIAVDRILGIRSLIADKEKLSNISHGIAAVASGVATVDQEQVVLIDPELLLECAELSALAS